MGSLPDNQGLVQVNSSTGELVTHDLAMSRRPELVINEATDAAVALQRIISAKAKPVIINGEQYLEYEDWAMVARFYNCTAKVTATTLIDINGIVGYEARALVLHNITGQEVSAADAMCLSDEQRWHDKPLFQLRSMAQTRACAKALRLVFSPIVVLAGYKPTPAEEIESSSKVKPSIAPPRERPKARAHTTPRPGEPLRINKVSEPHEGTTDGRKWTFWVITFSNGQEAGTFDTEVVKLAEKICTNDLGCEVSLEPGKKKGSWRIVELIELPSEPDEESEGHGDDV